MSVDKKNVLFVDDEPINLKIYELTFRGDFNVFVAVSGEEALEVLKNNENMDVIVTDQLMPEMDGVGLLKEIGEKYPHINLGKLIVSGFSENEDIEKAFENYDLSEFISKPWTKETIVEAIYESINKLETK